MAPASHFVQHSQRIRKRAGWCSARRLDQVSELRPCIYRQITRPQKFQSPAETSLDITYKAQSRCLLFVLTSTLDC